MDGKTIHYYAGGNTGKGFYNLFDSNLKGLDRLFILKGGPGTGKSSLMKKLANEWNNKGYDIEMIHCSSDNESIDGVIIPKLKFGIVDGTSPHVIEPSAPGVIDEYVNLGLAWNREMLSQNKESIINLQAELSSAFKAAYDSFAQSLSEHDVLEDIYIHEMDFNKANQLSEDFINKAFGDKSLNKTPDIRHRFLGAATPKGAVDFIPNITEGLQRRFFIKGRAGTGKSTFLKKVVTAAEERGFDTEVYHCGFDPNSLDMVVVRELSFAIFDSTDPHEYFPERDGDEIIDIYDAAVTPGTDERFELEIKDAHKKYKEKMREGTSFLAKAKALHDQLEHFYIEAMDFSKIDEIYKEINKEITSLT